MPASASLSEAASQDVVVVDRADRRQQTMRALDLVVAQLVLKRIAMTASNRPLHVAFDDDAAVSLTAALA